MVLICGIVFPLKIYNKIGKSICKILIKTKDKVIYGAGFFLRVSDKLKYLITNYHIINELNTNNENITLEITGGKIVKLTLRDRLIKYYKEPKDITAIEIKESDQFYKEVKFLDYDNNYIEKGYSIYKNKKLFSIYFSFNNKEEWMSKGELLQIKGYEFIHSINTCSGGSPILLLNDNINLIKVIGVQKMNDKYKSLGYGTLIGEIIKDIKFVNFESISWLDKNKLFINKNYNNSNNNNIINNYHNNLNSFKIKCNSICNNHIYNTINNHKLHNNIDNNIDYDIDYDIDYNINKTIEYCSKSNISYEKIKEILLVLTNEAKDVITLHFQSSDQSLNYAVRCKISEKFNVILNKIVDCEPKLVEIGFFCLSNGAKVNEYKTIKDNNFKDGDKIILELVD